MNEFGQAYRVENDRNQRGFGWWARRALAVIGITVAAATAVEVGPGMIDAYRYPPSPENDSARAIDYAFFNGGEWDMSLTKGNITMRVYKDNGGDGNLPTTETIRIPKADLQTIEGIKVSGDTLKVNTPGEDMETGTIPMVATAKVDGETIIGILEPSMMTDGTTVHEGKPLPTQVRRNDQGQLATSDGTTVDNVSFANSNP